MNEVDRNVNFEKERNNFLGWLKKLERNGTITNHEES